MGTRAQHQGQTNPLLPSGHKTGMERTISQNTLCSRNQVPKRELCSPSLQHFTRVGLPCTGGRSGWVPPCRDASVGGRKDSQEAKHGQRGSSRIWAHTGRAHERPTPPFPHCSGFASSLTLANLLSLLYHPPSPTLSLPISLCSSPGLCDTTERLPGTPSATDSC